MEYECSICGCSKFRAAENRPQKVCDCCTALERHRHIGRFLRVIPNDGMKILEIAPYSKYIFKDFMLGEGCSEYVTIDKWADGNPSDHRDVRFADVYHDVIGMSEVVGKTRFNLVLMQHVLEEIPNYISAISSIYDVMTVGGTLLIEEPVYDIVKTVTASTNKYGNLWRFSLDCLMNDLGVYFKVQHKPFTECGWEGNLFICTKEI